MSQEREEGEGPSRGHFQRFWANRILVLGTACCVRAERREDLTVPGVKALVSRECLANEAL